MSANDYVWKVERAREVHYDEVTKEEEASQCLLKGLNIRCGCCDPVHSCDANPSTSRASVTVTDATITGSLAALDALLPPDPGLPSSESVCATLTANLGSAAFSSPGATDPDIDNAASVASDSTSSNPDTARIQTALTRVRVVRSSNSYRPAVTTHFWRGP